MSQVKTELLNSSKRFCIIYKSLPSKYFIWSIGICKFRRSIWCTLNARFPFKLLNIDSKPWSDMWTLTLEKQKFNERSFNNRQTWQGAGRWNPLGHGCHTLRIPPLYRRIPQGPPGFGVFTVNTAHGKATRPGTRSSWTCPSHAWTSTFPSAVTSGRKPSSATRRGPVHPTQRQSRSFQLTGLLSDVNPSRIHHGDPCQLSGFFPLLGQVSLFSPNAPRAFHCHHHHCVMSKGTFWCLVKLWLFSAGDPHTQNINNLLGLFLLVWVSSISLRNYPLLIFLQYYKQTA